MNIDNMTKEDIMQVLAQKIAVDEFEHNLEVYQDEAEHYANSGVTESKHMDDGVIYSDWYCAEQLVGIVQEAAGETYEQLFKARYGRLLRRGVD